MLMQLGSWRASRLWCSNFKHKTMHHLPSMKWRSDTICYTKTSTQHASSTMKPSRTMPSWLEYCGGALGKEPGLVDDELEADGTDWELATDKELITAKAAAWEHVLAIGFLMGIDWACCGKLLEDLENYFMQGWDNYPPMLQQAYSLLIHWKQDLWNIIWLISGVNDGMAFANVGTKEMGQTSSNSDWWQEQEWPIIVMLQLQSVQSHHAGLPQCPWSWWWWYWGHHHSIWIRKNYGLPKNMRFFSYLIFFFT